ncbi:DUF3604 domain-containing protein [Rhizobium leguminosarum bv. viciae]|uniref:DUF3604 domain-containing protein n=1 Tax=Rhizobium leguminosarum bv. viciae TaxID=387 RepID=A0A8I2GTT9_RHILV|nr:DUF3604 domain-containing protein [Rhizobium leguminosarum]ASR10829.1 DUF3604 domain-containing protein [Rhizobium leguminosarum bv. viciae]MBY5790761.1 DUF3604 domain-containing protein [Rhizobium leguminosarum]NKM46157.1 DUF3604 domain-containing protein [Rhizobium leguminosarum bv. viciae]UFW82057.1 DUF3604 domain-containing protein [Rhizobium leguminosarum bv. viciae]
MNKTSAKLIVAGLVSLGSALPAAAQETTDIGTLDSAKAGKAFSSKPVYSPYAGRNFPTRPLFGDTHLHTGASFDAGAFGARLTPRDAYRFARGEEITASSGQPAKLSRPLDFLVVADHSDNMGMFPDLFAGKPEVISDPQARTWYEEIKAGQGGKAALEIIFSFGKGTLPKSMIYGPETRPYKNAWQDTIKAAEEYNDPGRFTAFIGYEWTSNTAGNNLHRNVVFRDNADKADQVVPYTTLKPLGSDNPRDLWKWMQAYEDKTGGNVLAIAHNGNLSNGRMFPLIESFTGKPVDKEYVEQRSRWERLYETTQTKGDGEAHPVLSPNDEFADFETWDFGNLDASVPKTPDMLEFEYTRSALKNGLKLEAELGTNPYKFGLVGSSDAHTGLAAMEEENFFGKTTPQEPSPERLTATFVKNAKTNITVMDWEVSASGYAAVWATENTRESIWDAMQRKETYATTGPRMMVRFFGGWDFEPTDAETRNPGVIGYGKGVPMGGDLTAAPEGKAPSFLVAALRDPIGGNLDRYQIVKGWLDDKGEMHEQVYDVAWGGDRKPGADGKVPSVGSTVDIENATWTNTIGAPELIAVWKDPSFDPKQKAFYYGRVIEIPTPRWTAYDAKRFGTKPLEGTRMTVIERAYTSPIWYTP